DYKYVAPVDSIPDHTQFHQIPNFELTSHKGLPFTFDSLKNKIWVVAFYSTNSEFVNEATKQLLQINFKYRHVEDIAILGLTLDSQYDTPEVLADYVEEVEAKSLYPDKWYFLTGDQPEINSLIREGFLIEDSTNIATMWLMDDNGHLRGRYNANFGEEIKKAKEDVALLKKEMDLREE
ncbi:MAG: redoxin domain-containing protein, partial [Flavobacteriales bacterium]|nr:redoxin domain-containing protein [Flavobacteriales bacterium]